MRPALAALVVVLAAGCSSGGGTTTVTTATTAAAASSAAAPASPLVGPAAAIPAAVAALEAARGGAQQYTDVNVTPDGVNLFVALGDGREVSYVWSAGALGPAGDPAPATLPSFTLDGVGLGVGPSLLDTVARRFPTGTVVRLGLVRRPDAGVVWVVGYRSERGGILDVLFGPRGGEPLGAIPES